MQNNTPNMPTSYSVTDKAAQYAEKDLTRMTELLTRHAFHHMSTDTIRSHPETRFAVLVMDISNFKSVNVFCSRQKGDEMLVYIADFLKDYWTGLTLVSHFRADTFALLVPFTEKNELIQLAMELHSHIDAFDLPFRVLMSVGICIADSPDMPANNMCDYATMALKTIKGKFYAKYAFYDESMSKQLLLEKQIENDIVSALESGHLKPFIQPKVDMRTGEIVGGEALVRWIHPTRGVISPGVFIPVLEKNGFIIDVDYHIWKEIYKFYRRRMDAGQKLVPISINISRMHAYDRIFTDRLKQLSRDYKVPASLILLELTESAFLNDTNSVYNSILELKEHGYSLSMDDFGTGYSTMTMLRNQPVDEVKIDKGFIDDIEDKNVQIILSNIIRMLQELGKKIIVEGVETPEQRDYLIDHGCYHAQGFLYYKPMPMEKFETLLDQ